MKGLPEGDALSGGLRLIRKESVTSTNDFLLDYTPSEGEEMTVCLASRQTAGRGQGTNVWESEPERNLLFSLLIHPVWVPVREQFVLSMANAVALKDVLDGYTEGISLKWPNDIYWHDRKLAGTLIENRLSGGRIKDCVIGTGLNVNQREFHSDAPNPVSLWQILSEEKDVEEILAKYLHAMKGYLEKIRSGNYGAVIGPYYSSLYRREGFWPYRDADGLFEASILEVESDGHLILRDKEGVVRSYAFKEVEFIIDNHS